MAESTFGRLAVNDGKLVNRLRLGGRVTTDTVDRVRAFIAREPQPAVNGAAVRVPSTPPHAAAPTSQNFRFAPARHRRVLPPRPHGGIHLRAAGGERRQAGQPAAPRRARHHRHGGPRARLHRPRAAAAAVNGAPVRVPPAPPQTRRRHHPQLPLLRQPAEIPAVRHHLRREVGDRPTRRHGTGQHPPTPAGAAPVRRRHGRRHGARPHHARHAQPLPDHAVLHRGQGDQPRGRAPRAGEDARPAVRASGDRAGDDQHVLLRGAVAEAELGQRRHQPRLARAVADRQHRARVRDADHRTRPVPRRQLARAA